MVFKMSHGTGRTFVIKNFTVRALRFIKKHPLFIPSIFIVVPLLMIVKLIKPLYFVRFVSLRCERMGHFVYDAAENKARQQRDAGLYFDFFWIGKPCNVQWAKMVEREIPIYSFVRYLDFYARLIPGFRDHSRSSSETRSADIYRLYDRFDISFPLTELEQHAGRKQLGDFGVSDDKQFVCLLVRDEAYMATRQDLITGNDSPEQTFAYHSYRNSQIDDYNLAVRWLLDRGYVVFRMGSVASKKADIDHENFIDYAFHESKSPFMDVWLYANCAASISTASGIDALARVYRKPMLMLNALPVADFNWYAESIWIPKTLIWQKTKQPLTLAESVKHRYGMAEQYEEKGISIESLSENEILEATKELIFEAEGLIEFDDQQKEIQKLAQLVFKQHNSSFPANMDFHPKARFGSKWLKDRKSSFFR